MLDFQSETSQIGKINSILSFVVLKASNIKRYTADNMWCMDRGLGLFAGLNVLSNAAWFSSYSHRVTRSMNLSFLKSLHNKWVSEDLLSDTVNLDFTTITYWGNNEHLENNYSRKRNKGLPSMLAVLAQDADSGIIDYGNTNVMHENESAVVLEFLDFYCSGADKGRDLKFLKNSAEIVIDSEIEQPCSFEKMKDNYVSLKQIWVIFRDGKCTKTNRLLDKWGSR